MKKLLSRLTDNPPQSLLQQQRQLPSGMRSDMGLSAATTSSATPAKVAKRRLTVSDRIMNWRNHHSESALNGSNGMLTKQQLPQQQQQQQRYFAVPLQELLDREPSVDHIPEVLRLLIEYLTQSIPASCEGIFRLAGSSKTIKEIRERIEKRDTISSIDLNDYRVDVNAVASVLKQLIRELPGGLISGDNYAEFIQASESVDQLKRAADRLLPVNYWILRYVMAMCVRVAQFHEVNKMGPSNLAVVWAPNLFLAPGKQQDQVGSISEIVDSVRLSAVVMNMIEQFDQIFLSQHPLTVSERKVLGRQAPNKTPAPPNKHESSDAVKQQHQHQQLGPIAVNMMSETSADEQQISPSPSSGAVAVQSMLDELKQRIDSAPVHHQQPSPTADSPIITDDNLIPGYAAILKAIKRSREPSLSSANHPPASVLIHNSGQSSAASSSLPSPSVNLSKSQQQSAMSKTAAEALQMSTPKIHEGNNNNSNSNNNNISNNNYNNNNTLPRSIIKQNREGSLGSLGSPVKTVRFSLINNQTVKFESDDTTTTSSGSNSEVSSVATESSAPSIPPSGVDNYVNGRSMSPSYNQIGSTAQIIKDPLVSKTAEIATIRLSDAMDKIQRISELIYQPLQGPPPPQLSNPMDMTLFSTKTAAADRTINSSTYSADVLRMLNSVALSRQRRVEDGQDHSYDDGEDEDDFDYNEGGDEIHSIGVDSVKHEQNQQREKCTTPALNGENDTQLKNITNHQYCLPRPPKRPAPEPPQLHLESSNVSSPPTTSMETLDRPPLRVQTNVMVQSSPSPPLHSPPHSAAEPPSKNPTQISSIPFDPTNLSPIEFNPYTPFRSLPSAERNRLRLLVRCVHRELQQHVEYLQGIKQLTTDEQDPEYSDKLDYYREEFRTFLTRRRLFESLKSYVKSPKSPATTFTSSNAASTYPPTPPAQTKNIQKPQSPVHAISPLDPMTPISPQTERPLLERLKHLLKKEIASVRQILDRQSDSMTPEQLQSVRQALKDYYERYRQIKQLLDATNVSPTGLSSANDGEGSTVTTVITKITHSSIINNTTTGNDNQRTGAQTQSDQQLKKELIGGLQKEKRQLQQALLEYQKRFQAENGGRSVDTAADRQPMADKYSRYQDVKRRLQQLQA